MTNLVEVQYARTGKSNGIDARKFDNVFFGIDKFHHGSNARKEPTYLCADVEVVAIWKVYNVKSSAFEALIHKLFASVQLQLAVDGHRPKECFIVPFKVIKQAINYIIARQPIQYDVKLQQLVLLD